LTIIGCSSIFSFTLLRFSPLSFFVILHWIRKHPITMFFLHINPFKVEKGLRWN
jgi:hypothetical protein